MISPGIVPNNNVIVKSENIIGLSPNHKMNSTGPLNLFDIGNLTSFERDRPANIGIKEELSNYQKSYKKSLSRKHKKKHKEHKCIHKLLHSKKKKHKFRKAKKMLLPVLLGLFFVTNLFVSILLKTLIVIASKGLLLTFFSTIMTTILGFRGTLHNGYNRHRKNDKIQEIYVYRMRNDNTYYGKPYSYAKQINAPRKHKSLNLKK